MFIYLSYVCVCGWRSQQQYKYQYRTQLQCGMVWYGARVLVSYRMHHTGITVYYYDNKFRSMMFVSGLPNLFPPPPPRFFFLFKSQIRALYQYTGRAECRALQACKGCVCDQEIPTTFFLGCSCLFENCTSSRTSSTMFIIQYRTRIAQGRTREKKKNRKQN